MYNILEKINSPADLKALKWNEIDDLCAEIRQLLVKTVTKTGGHLASNLGVVELTAALHLVYDLPTDKLIWDVGHQSYVHKILTGRRDRFETLRSFGGISGFPKTGESEYDCFNTGHSSTSVSAAVGMARARDLYGEKYSVAAVFGDGAMTGGMIYEALNDVGNRKTPIVFVLNDNEMSISRNVGGLSKYLRNLRQTQGYHRSKERVENILDAVPVLGKKAKRGIIALKDAVKLSILPSTFFDDLGIEYLGPVDGHNISELVRVLTLAKNMNEPVLVHVITKKGKGYEPAETNPQKFHGISPSGQVSEIKTEYADYSECTGKTLLKLAQTNKNFIAVTAAMRAGVGLLEFSKKYPKRFFDVGIAEQHAVTFSAGLAASGITPVFAVYSSFLQRAYDQLLHDICLQKLHAVILADRAGIVGADGETHHGLYDIAFLSTMPGMKVLSPSSFEQLEQMLDYAVNTYNAPIAIRYPRGNLSVYIENFMPDKANLIKDGRSGAIVTTGRMLSNVLSACEMLENEEIKVKIIELPTVSPLPVNLVDLLEDVEIVMSVEDHCISGGLGSLVSKVLAEKKSSVKLLVKGFPNEPVVHGTAKELDKEYGLDMNGIYKSFKELAEVLNG